MRHAERGAAAPPRRFARIARIATTTALLISAIPARAQTPPAPLPSQPATASPAPEPSTAPTTAYPLGRSPNDNALADQARARGAQLRKAGLTDGAKDAYRRAYAAAGRLDDARAVAELAESTGELAEAADVLAFLLKGDSSAMKPADRSKLTAKLTTLEAGLALLNIEVGEPGAAVVVDGRQRGQSPLPSMVRLAPGRHFVQVTKRDKEPFETALELTAGQRETVVVTFSAPVTTGELQVTASGSTTNARVFIDGNDAGPAPFRGQVEGGVHLVLVRSDTAVSQPMTVLVPVKRAAKVALEVASLTAKVAITAEPEEAVIRVDDAPIVHGRFTSNLPFGTHHVEVSASGYDKKTFDVVIERTDEVTKRVRLVQIGPAQPVADYDGMYGGVGVAGWMDVTSPSTSCPASTSCDAGSTLGGSLAFDLGYRFGLFGVGVHAQGFFGYRSLSLTKSAAAGAVRGTYDGSAFTESVDAYTYGGFFGVSPRLMTKSNVALDVGLTPGVLVQQFALARALSGDISERVTQNASSTAFATMLDAGMLAGGMSPGSKFRLSLFVLAAFHGDDVVTPAGTQQSAINGVAVTRPVVPISLASSFELRAGFMLGAFFGH